MYDRSSLFYYLKNNPNDQIKIHLDCCGGTGPMYLGFSRNSKNMDAIENTDYNEKLPISIDNFTIKPKKSLIVANFTAILEKIKVSGITQAIYDKHYK